MSPLKQLVVFGEKSVFEESVFSLEKEEQALKVTSLKRMRTDAYRGKFLKKKRKILLKKKTKFL